MAYERAITEMEILGVKIGEKGATVIRIFAAFIAMGNLRMAGCRLRLSSPIRAERSCSTVSFEKSLKEKSMSNTLPFLYNFKRYIKLL